VHGSETNQPCEAYGLRKIVGTTYFPYGNGRDWCGNSVVSWEVHGQTPKKTMHSGDFMGFTLWLFNIAMENGPFIDDFPI
jgi:hypothetical protein